MKVSPGNLFPLKPEARLRIYAWSPNDPPVGYAGLLKVGQTTKADVNVRIRESQGQMQQLRSPTSRCRCSSDCQRHWAARRASGLHHRTRNPLSARNRFGRASRSDEGPTDPTASDPRSVDLMILVTYFAS